MPQSTIGGFLLLCVIFGIGIGFGKKCWNLIALPFRNPWEMISPMAAIKFNPDTDPVRFACFVLFPVLLLLLVYFLNIKKINKLAFRDKPAGDDASPKLPLVRMAFVVAVLVTLFALASLYVPTDIASMPYVDTFHEGESLGPAMMYMRGEVPYKDFAVHHGIFQDPLRSVLAFKLFGKSIGAQRTIQSLLKMLEFSLLAGLIVQLFNGNYIWSLSVGLAFLLMIFVNLIGADGRPLGTIAHHLQRDLTGYVFLIAIIALFRRVKTDSIRPSSLIVAGFLSAFIAFGTFIYSAERGVFLSTAYVILSVFLYFVYIHKSPFRLHYITSSIMGVLSAVALLDFLLRGNLAGFADFEFRLVPGFWGLMGSSPFPIGQTPFLTVLILIAANAYWVLLKFLRQCQASDRKMGVALRRFADKYFIELSLLMCSVFFFRYAFARPDWGHVAVSAKLSYLLSLVIIFRHYAPVLLRGRSKAAYGYSLIALLAVLAVCVANRTNIQSLITGNFPLQITDSEFIPDNYKATIEFLRGNLREDETFYTLTSEGIWYYFVEKPSPTRFLVLFMAGPNFLQEEVVRDLEKKKVKFIIVANSHWTNNFDGYNTEMRFPIIVGYVKRRYAPFTQIDDNLIWIRKSEQHG